MTAQKVSHYRIINKLGAGGMGEVYLAEDTRLNRKVALKFLPAHLVADQQAKKRLIREAQAAAALDHPNICAIYEVGEDDGRTFIVMQCVDGETLASRIQHTPIELKEVLDIAVQVADALSEAHSRGIIHRDIKPQNIMLTARRQAKVMDFGLAKTVPDPDLTQSVAETESLLTEPGAIVGTVPYMSPEQVRGQTLDARSDTFSFGAVVYEMISGHQPFASETAAVTFSAILTREPPPLARYSREVPAELERIVSKTLRKDREERYQTVSDLLIDLKNLRREPAVEAKQGRSVPPNLNSTSPAAGEVVNTIDQQVIDSTSKSERLTSVMKRRPRGVVLAAGVVLTLFVGALVYALLFRHSPATTALGIKSLAVLPLDNLSGDPAQEYFADGMTEELIASLGKIGNLRVISRTSVMQYKGARKPLPEIARELDVDAVVEGSALRSGDRVRITVQLIHGATDRHLWAESYQRDLRDILAVQSEVGRAIANEIRIKLTPQEQSLLLSSRSVNPQALDTYLKGRDYFNQGLNKLGGNEGRELLKSSIGYFEQAVSIDPSYALAYAGLSAANHWLASRYRLSEFYPHAKEAAMKALQLDETLAEAHASLAFTMQFFDLDWVGAEREYKRAIELNPNSGAHHGYALYLMTLGHHEQAIREIDLAQELDPLTIPLKVNAGAVYLYARQYDRAIEQWRRVIELNSSTTGLRLNIGLAYVHKGMYDEGIAELRKALGSNAPRSAILAWACAVSGKRSEARKILDESLKALSEGISVSKINIASAYTALADKDQAFAWLERAFAERRDSLFVLKVEPAFDSLRSDPRYADLLRRIGLKP